MSRSQTGPTRPRTGSGKELLGLLRGLDGSSYGAYKRALGTWNFGDYQVIFDRLQSDPYAPPSAVRVRYERAAAGLDSAFLETDDQRLATADFLARTFHSVVRLRSTQALSIARPGQEILERSSATVLPEAFELRISVRMPARGRTILGKAAAQIFAETLPAVLGEVFNFTNTEHYEAWLAQVKAVEDYLELRNQIEIDGLANFIANGSMLARKSGISQLPLEGGVPFESPPSLARTYRLPYAGEITGMGVPAGITLLVGGGYHGKSTVLNAVERGVYPHIPGDGRELVATSPTAVKLRAADGRPVTKVDVSPFINHLPTRADTREFSTENASGSTSEAASLIEAVQAGSDLLLVDEDTSATNLLIRDSRMRRLVSASQEPITPLIDRIRGLNETAKVSLIMVMGGSSDYFDVADLVLQMDAYRCEDVTDRARELARELPRFEEDLPGFPELRERVVIRGGNFSDRPKTKAAGLDRFELDRESVDIGDVEQVVDSGQTEAIAYAVRAITGHLANGEETVLQLAQRVLQLIDEHGLDALVKFGARKKPAFLVRPRLVDVIAGANRLRTLQIK